MLDQTSITRSHVGRQRGQRPKALLRHNADFRNGEAARLIISNADRFGGPEAGLVRWAWLVLGRLQPQQNLFRGGAW